MSVPPILIFDFDGVVITQRSLELAAQILLKKKFYGWQNVDDLRLIEFARIFEEEDSSNRLKALRGIYKAFKPYIPIGWKRIIFFVRFRRLYPKYEKLETLKEDLENILEILKNAGFILGIASNTSGKRLDQFRARLELDKFFDTFVSRRESPYRKPNPFAVLLALKNLKEKLNIPIQKNKTYFIGDLPSDIRCAKNANVNSIAILSGHGRKDDLERENPTHVIKNHKEILELEPFKKYLLD